MPKKEVTIYTDGACSGNPGPGGWAAILKYGGREKVLSGGENPTTNNRMELRAVISALEALKEPCKVKLYSDSNTSATPWRRAGRGPGRPRAGEEATRAPRKTPTSGKGSLSFWTLTRSSLYG